MSVASYRFLVSGADIRGYLMKRSVVFLREK